MEKTDNQEVKIITEYTALMDIDLALMCILQKEYNNPKYIGQQIMNLNFKDIKTLLLNRKYENPLYLCMTDKAIADNVYCELLTKRYDDIVKLSAPNGVLKLLELYRQHSDMYNIKVVCNNQTEVDRLYEFAPKLKTCIGSFKNIKNKDFDVVFVKSLTHICLFPEEIKNKHIFTLGYRYNLDFVKDSNTLIPNITISKQLIPQNRVGIVNVYDKEEGIHLVLR